MPRIVMGPEVRQYAHTCHGMEVGCKPHAVLEGRSCCCVIANCLSLWTCTGTLRGLALALCADYLPSYVQVLATNFPDPGMTLVDGTYYAFGTNSSSGSSNISAATSTDLVRAASTPGCTTVPRSSTSS